MPSSTRTSGASIARLADSRGVKPASRIAMRPARSEGFVISIASSKRVPFCVDAPTVSTHGALDGEPIVA